MKHDENLGKCCVLFGYSVYFHCQSSIMPVMFESAIMSISFIVKPDAGYFISKYTGKITDRVLLSSYRRFHEGNDWIPGLHEFADLSEADMTAVTQNGLRELSAYIESVYRKYGQSFIKTAAYAPADLPFGIARVYEALSSDSPEQLKAFRDVQDAMTWLSNKEVISGHPESSVNH